MSEEKKLSLFEVVMTLNGSVTPAGESNLDAQRLENMENLIALWDQIHDELDHVAHNYKDDQRFSVKLLGNAAHKALENVRSSDE
jgi:hypothetical protein